MLNRMRNKQGFTLIELLIVVAIIGILAAIAIPQFSKYRIQGYNSSANSDLKNCRTSQESLMADWQGYGSSVMQAFASPIVWAGGTVAATAGAPVGAPVGGNVPALVMLDRSSVNRGVQLAVGNNVTLFSGHEAVAAGEVCASFTVLAKHLQGDTAYGADGDSTKNYKNNTPATYAPGIAAVAGVASLVGTDEFSALAGWVTM